MVRVYDQGIGIPEPEHGRLFDRFYRASNASIQHLNGLGVGLWISKQIMEQHGGRIWLETSSPKGSIFAFALPLADTA